MSFTLLARKKRENYARCHFHYLYGSLCDVRLLNNLNITYLLATSSTLTVNMFLFQSFFSCDFVFVWFIIFLVIILHYVSLLLFLFVWYSLFTVAIFVNILLFLLDMELYKVCNYFAYCLCYLIYFFVIVLRYFSYLHTFFY